MNYINTTYITGQTPKVYVLEGLNVVKNILFSLLEKKSEVWIHGLAENENVINILKDYSDRMDMRVILVMLMVPSFRTHHSTKHFFF